MELWEAIVGPNSTAITWWQMSIRGVLIFFFLVALLRLGSSRAFGQLAAFDIVLSVILGSILSRALTGNAPLGPTLAASAVLMFLHYLLAVASYRTSWVAPLVKGRHAQIVREGEILWEGMREAKITEHDLHEEMRRQGMHPDPSKVDAAFIERDGSISIITE